MPDTGKSPCPDPINWPDGIIGLLVLVPMKHAYPGCKFDMNITLPEGCCMMSIWSKKGKGDGLFHAAASCGAKLAGRLAQLAVDEVRANPDSTLWTIEGNRIVIRTRAGLAAFGDLINAVLLTVNGNKKAVEGSEPTYLKSLIFIQYMILNRRLPMTGGMLTILEETRALPVTASPTQCVQHLRLPRQIATPSPAHPHTPHARARPLALGRAVAVARPR